MAHVAGGLGCFLQRGIVEDVEHLTVTMGDVLGQLVCLATKSIVQGVVPLKTQPLDNYWKKRAFFTAMSLENIFGDVELGSTKVLNHDVERILEFMICTMSSNKAPCMPLGTQ